MAPANVEGLVFIVAFYEGCKVVFGKVLATFAVLLLQPEQTPFTLQDGWTWLARTVNLCAQYIHSSKTTPSSPPFFIATTMEVFLRVAARGLFQAFGEPFMRLLKCIKEKILPQCSADMPKREALKEFLQRFIDSNGKDFMSLFQKN